MTDTPTTPTDAQPAEEVKTRFFDIRGRACLYWAIAATIIVVALIAGYVSLECYAIKVTGHPFALKSLWEFQRKATP